MSKKQASQTSSAEKIVTRDQISSGGVAYRWQDLDSEIAIVSVKPSLRWQLPKGIVDPGESPEVTAVREVREEAGIETDLLSLIETIEYWFRSTKYGKPIRFHKFVHFYLLSYRSGDVTNHDHEVAEARWVHVEEAMEMLAFKSERQVVEKAKAMVEKMR
jgi:8-oxo-dGTP diphosphatase